MEVVYRQNEQVFYKVVKLLTQAGRTQGTRRWCSPSSRGPWRCRSEARPRRPSPSPRIRTDGSASRSPAGPQGKRSHGVRCWSPGSGCNRWARRLTPSHSLWPGLEKTSHTSTTNLQLIDMSWWDGISWWICWHLCRSLSLHGLAKHAIDHKLWQLQLPAHKLHHVSSEWLPPFAKMSLTTTTTKKTQWNERVLQRVLFLFRGNYTEKL